MSANAQVSWEFSPEQGLIDPFCLTVAVYLASWVCLWSVIFRGPILLSRPFSTCPHVFSPQNNLTDCSWVCPTHTFLQVTPSHRSQHALHQHVFLSGRRCVARIRKHLSGAFLLCHATGQDPQSRSVSPEGTPVWGVWAHVERQFALGWTPGNTAQAETAHVWGLWKSISSRGKPVSAAQVACWQETLQKQHEQSLVFEELQIPSVREIFYL